MEISDQLLRSLWVEVINPMHTADTLEEWVASAEQNPETPFSDTGKAIQGLLGLGAAPRQIALVQRAAAFGAVLGTLMAQGAGDSNLADSLLNADPSGLRGKPGSAPDSAV